MEYKGIKATELGWSVEDNCFYAVARPDFDMLIATGNNEQELQQDFNRAVQDYLDFKEELTKQFKEES